MTQGRDYNETTLKIHELEEQVMHWYYEAYKLQDQGKEIRAQLCFDRIIKLQREIDKLRSEISA